MKHAPTSHFGHLRHNNKPFHSDTVSTTISPTPDATSKIANTSICVPDVVSNTRCLNSAVTHKQMEAPHINNTQHRSQPTGTTGLPTPVNSEALSKWLEGYPNRATIVSIFAQGAMIDFKGINSPLTSANSQSAILHAEAVTHKLQEELSKNRIAGPFSSIPLEQFKISPLALREKQETGKYRLLHNLSFPYDEQSVNYNIPKTSTHVKYESISDAIESIHHCSPTAYMAKSDIADAFRIVPLHPSQYHLTGFSWQGYYYYDKCLPQGCASSCKIFESISSAIKWILECKLGVTNVVKVLDDFFFVGRTKQQCQDALDKFLYICQQLGIPLATHKTVGPTQVITFLGIELDTTHMTARLPIDKLNRYRDHILTIAKQNKATLREIKSITGQLQFATTVITSGRPFLRRLYDLTMLVKKPHHYIRLTQQVKLDLDVWLHFLQHYNGKTFIHQQVITDSTTAHFYSDASKTAFGATYGTHWIQGEWPANWQLEEITVLELYPIFLAIHIFQRKMTNAHIVFHCDNSGIVAVLNKQSSKHKPLMSIIRPLVLALLQSNVTFHAEHIPGVDNILCDAISRHQVTAEMLHHYGMRLQKTPIPEQLQPNNFKLR